MSTPPGAAVRLAAPLRALRAEATALFDLAVARAWDAADRTTLAAMRDRAAALLGHPAGRRVRSDDPVVADCVEFAEQFVLDVAGVGEVQRERLRRHLGGPALTDLVRAFHVVEYGLRLELASARLFDGPLLAGSPGPAGPDGDPSTALRAATTDFQDAAVRGRALDPVLTELVRLRCARTHGCRICQTLRLADAREAGVDDAMTAAVDRYESSDLAERSKAALRVADAVVLLPSGLTAEVVAGVHGQLGAEELAELCLDVTKWSTQKVHVALGTDGAERLPLNEQGVSFFSFDEAGRVAGFSADLHG
ncbi:carboxymuconolactone decarboxylase family protein [Trujillonella humicola]|uniref:carboxymuconolactone decarboxylase family protein n=1 Tax=Trujillonella humicola TaxID=3383699 RepID=UPI003905E1A8